MPIINWTDNLSVGIDAMDTQHKKLFDLTNRLFDAMHEGKGKQILEGILSELVSYTKTHLTSEEKLMQQYNYPSLADHKQLHADLLAKVTNFCNEFNAGNLGITIKLCEFLCNWLKVHISQEDKQYAAHIASQAVAVK